MEVVIERWRIDGRDSPRLIEDESVTVPCEDIQWSAYSTPCSRKLPLVPQNTSVISPGPFAVMDNGRGVRLGSLIIAKRDDSPGWQFIQAATKLLQATPSSSTERSREREHDVSNTSDTESSDTGTAAATLTEYCEEIAYNSKLLVICRRKIPKSSCLSKRSNRQRRHRRSYSSDEGSEEEGQGSDEEDHTGATAFSDTSSLKSAAPSDDLSDGLKSEPDCEESSDEKSGSYKGSIDTHTETSDFDIVSDSDKSNDIPDSFSSAANSDDEKSDDSDASSLLSASTSESSGDEVQQMLNGEDELESTDYQYPVNITRGMNSRNLYCNRCDEYQTLTWYYCPRCPYDQASFDVCHQCIKQGQWCDDRSHQLYEIVQGVGVVGVLSWDNFTLGQELLVFDTSSEMEAPIFSHSTCESTTLHRSEPAIHPALHMVVWPTSAEELLFVQTGNLDAGTKKCFSLQTLKASHKKGMCSYTGIGSQQNEHADKSTSTSNQY